jgi:hypothetical protein
MRRRYLRMALPLVMLLGIGDIRVSGQATDVAVRKPVLLVSGTAIGFAGPSVPLVEELVIHNDGLVTLETTSGTENCQALRRFVNPADVEKLRTDLLAAGAFDQEDFNPGQTADLPHTTVTLFRGSSGSRLDETASFTYERVSQLPPRLAEIRALIQAFVETTFVEFKKNGCHFPF